MSVVLLFYLAMTRSTLDPLATTVPASGTISSTVPGGLPVPPLCFTFTSNPSAVSVSVALVESMLYTLGMVTVDVVGLGVGDGDGEPLDTTMLTADPFVTSTPAAGSCRITSPLGTVVLGSGVGVPSTRPAPASATCAWS